MRSTRREERVSDAALFSRTIRNRSGEIRPGSNSRKSERAPTITAHWVRIERAYRVDLQDWLGWLDAGQLDFAVPMLYTRDATLLRYGVETYAGLARRRELWVGLGSWLFADAPALAAEQLRLASAEPGLGTALFSWDSIRETPALLSALATDVAHGGAAAPR